MAHYKPKHARKDPAKVEARLLKRARLQAVEVRITDAVRSDGFVNFGDAWIDPGTRRGQKLKRRLSRTDMRRSDPSKPLAQ